ncbi:ATP synthase, F0 complex, subunit b/b', bacterial/chloroplast like protein [Aduncisulcus paluster]|uniref:ATP synthase, F0 complex, subunit b/b', bacterial/chloroplast like protein n=2 Tax=cellular organisms TaxID=131567 RepID=A0ABQ5KS15_9EUKA|nr:ATP synthase, F0 complex, subunit b/b', bacterial/chloroplast like protein [Aduncisulcus paluster]
MSLFASDAGVETDILERTVNFFIFVAIMYYLLSDKLKTFFGERTESIQSELDKVQEILKESDKKLVDAKQEVENAKKVADELISTATSEVEAIKTKIDVATEQEIASLSKSFDNKTELEVRKVKKEVVENVLNQLLSDDNIALSQKDLANIITKKVA